MQRLRFLSCTFAAYESNSDRSDFCILSFCILQFVLLHLDHGDPLSLALF